MQISEDKKKSIFLKSFELLKDEENSDTWEKLSDVIVKMFAIDKDIAIDMWEYLLQKNQSFIQEGTKGCCKRLILDIWSNAKREIGRENINNIILNDVVIKKVIFSYDSAYYYLNDRTPEAACDIIQYLLITDCLQEANDCLELLYHNQYRQASWYDVMDHIIEKYELKDHMNDNIYELLETWSENVNSEGEKAKLTLKLMEFVD